MRVLRPALAPPACSPGALLLQPSLFRTRCFDALALLVGSSFCARRSCPVLCSSPALALSLAVARGGPSRCLRLPRPAVARGGLFSLLLAAAYVMGGFSSSSSSSSSSKLWLLWYNHSTSPSLVLAFVVFLCSFARVLYCFKCCFLVFCCAGMFLALLSYFSCAVLALKREGCALNAPSFVPSRSGAVLSYCTIPFIPLRRTKTRSTSATPSIH